MSKLRASLLPLFQAVWPAHDMPHKRIQDVELDLSAKLLTQQKDKAYAITHQLLSFGHIHRFILVMSCPDQAFYPDAIRTYLQKQYIQPLQLHTILFARDGQDSCKLSPARPDTKTNALLLVFHFSAATTENIQTIEKDMLHVLEGVHQSVSDFPDMLGRLENAAAHLAAQQPDTAALLRWMLDKHYLLFGLWYVESSRRNLGICRRKKLLSYIIPQVPDELHHVRVPEQVGMQWLHLSSMFHHVYSHTNVRALQITWLEQKKLQSVVVIGHFSRSARYTNASQLPQLDRLWQNMAKDVVLKQSAFYQREIRMLFDRAPKSLLHSIPASQWLAPFKNMVDMKSPMDVVAAHLQPRQGNLDYILIALSSHRFGDNIWQHIQDRLADLGIQIWGYEGYDVGATHLIFVAASAKAWPAEAVLQQAIQPCVVFWKDKAKQALLGRNLPTPLLHTALQALNQVSQLYQNQFPPEQFVEDVLAEQDVLHNRQVLVRLALAHRAARHGVEVQILAAESLPLAVMTEKLNAFALVTMEQAKVDFHTGLHADSGFHVCRFYCEVPEQLHPEGLPRLRQGIADVFNGLADHDPLNALLILAGLQVRDVLVLIALRNHLAQLMPNVSIGALSQVMIKHQRVTQALFRWFEGKHRPGMPRTQMAQAEADFKKAMQDVQNLKEDTWLRALFTIVQASLRTNAWQRPQGEAIAIKVNPSAIAFAPSPRPYREIFVHGVYVEGVHLRAGKIARGGLRYSDRPTDFRTEVLELMATQVVKNGQIVPTGAKGGFVVRDGKGADFVLAQYHQFIRALLSITDNRIGGKLVPPRGIRIDEQDRSDAYLVVAADKGTARYSDDANEEALRANFWLGDAFASGGSYGYDHKAFGITAKGAWVCAAHHFSGLGVDLNRDEVTVVGIGDMSGDVFGNGMLLNPNLKLVAAFNHQHIFLDPDPDTAIAFAERKRLFATVKGWGDYDEKRISPGGGVFARAAKSIPLSRAVRQRLDIRDTSLSGEALIRAILQAPVDLLYNGGIGTYVKASFESHADAQDPANNTVRIDADMLRAKVVCEGGNLGFTQAARLQFAKVGGLINTDAIDNAAGVNMSDHEVNLKILLADIPLKQRNRWLEKVAHDVAAQCLQDNKEQAIALSLAQETAKHHLPRLQYLREKLIADGYLSETFNEPLQTLRPALAVWLGHEKNRIHQILDEQGFYQLGIFGQVFLTRYFPGVLRQRFASHMPTHSLAADIAHTRIASHLINRYGLTSIHYLQQLTFASEVKIVQVLLIADALLATGDMYQAMFSDGAGQVADWYVIQQDVINFAEGLLALPDVMAVNQAWLRHTRATLQAYAEKQGKDVIELTPLVTAIALSEQVDASLAVCLDMTEQCLAVLPFAPLEASLRTPLWASDEAHALRREWLNRLLLMKVQAARTLLERSVKSRQILLQDWQTHVLQQGLQALLQKAARSEQEDAQRMHYLLALTHLQTIVECQCHLGQV